MMNKKRKNSKGFTLIELLAVIVILAVLILLAMPQVIEMMERARKNSFKVETQELLKIVDTVYADKMMSGGLKNITITVGGTSGVPARYLCLNLQELYEGGYTSKDFDKSNYSGFVEIFVPSSGKTVYGINISNGSYSYRLATSSKLAADSAIDNMGTETSIGTCKTGADAGKPVYDYSKYANDGFTP